MPRPLPSELILTIRLRGSLESEGKIIIQSLIDTSDARFRAYGPHHLNTISTRFGLTEGIQHAVEILSQLMPFRVNEYVLSELIDWRDVPDDPIFQLVFPQRGMLASPDMEVLERLKQSGATRAAMAAPIREIRSRLNPHPAGQLTLNVPDLGGRPLEGVQHKYRETVLYFPAQGQTCHAYCTYCFRWAQFVGENDLRFAAVSPKQLITYLRQCPQVSDVLVTGGDPMMMSTSRLATHLLPLLEVDTVRTIRIGTKSIAYWPHRYLTDPDAETILRLFEKVVASGRQLAVMAHFSHVRELQTDAAQRSVARLRSTGAMIYCQAPLVAHVNDDPQIWSDMWRTELAMGTVPYYLFVERDTGPYDYFKVPLTRAVEIFQTAYQSLPGLARTVRGPVMSTSPGKVVVDGVEDTTAGPFFHLRLLQARNPALVGRPFRAKVSATAAWLSDLELASDTPVDIALALAAETRGSGHQ